VTSAKFNPAEVTREGRDMEVDAFKKLLEGSSKGKILRIQESSARIRNNSRHVQRMIIYIQGTSLANIFAQIEGVIIRRRP
jgi:hypothetical protein